ncbi:MAG: hypothetical protein JETT_1672 [Candidatus Jettenia ecosi]|uniref:Uncharacterized protein n=1 Tax=Candidatus Jettenia ecosi TaxID=2494326 RepID=A0A533QBL0_9BACT|nr:MAG: hypothetical protein JETT_1672 [Candidatus Jettenia ecosi]
MVCPCHPENRLIIVLHGGNRTYRISQKAREKLGFQHMLMGFNR